MIECPICHVMNEEQAHFCSECGQRFAPPTQQQAPPQPQPQFQSPSFPAPEPAFPSFPPPDQASFQPQPQPQPQQPVYQQPPQDYAYQAPQSEPQSYQYSEPPQMHQPQIQPQAPIQAPIQPHQGFPPLQSQVSPAFGSPEEHSPQSQTFPPEQSISPADVPPPTTAPPPRPKLHSPLFDGPADAAEPIDDRSRQMPQKPTNPGSKQIRGLRSPLLGDDDDGGSEPPVQPRGKGGLRSPLLRGEDDPDAPQSPKGKGGLRSPLLGGDDEDNYAPQSPQKPARPMKPQQPRSGSGSHLRSPLLGGVDDYEGDDDDDLPAPPSGSGRTAFPHVRRQTKEQDHPPEPVDQASSGRTSAKHLRSPLLGGGDEDFDDQPPAPRSPSGKFSTGGGNRPRLHSPVLDGAGAQNFEYENDEPYYEEIDDPNVLRSPLLAARTKAAQEPTPPEAPPAVSQRQMRPAQQPSPQPPEPVQPLRPSPAPPPSPAQPSFPDPGPNQAQFRDRGFPEPEPASGSDMWRERGFQEAPRVPLPGSGSAYSPPEVAPSIKDTSPGSLPTTRKGRSPLLPKSDEDEQPMSGSLRHVSTEPPKPNMLLIAPVCLGLVAKLYYMSAMGNQLFAANNGPWLMDNLGQMVVMVGLIIFAATAGKR